MVVLLASTTPPNQTVEKQKHLLPVSGGLGGMWQVTQTMRVLLEALLPQRVMPAVVAPAPRVRLPPPPKHSRQQPSQAHSALSALSFLSWPHTTPLPRAR